eukprot:2253496-Pyramimonas_sp.AAC.1
MKGSKSNASHGSKRTSSRGGGSVVSCNPSVAPTAAKRAKRDVIATKPQQDKKAADDATRDARASSSRTLRCGRCARAPGPQTRWG